MKPSEKIDFSNVGELTRQLTAQKITPPRFSLEVSQRDAANGIYAAMKAEVAYRRRELKLDDDTKVHIQQVAEWLTDPQGRPGLLLQGLPGNGKTTMMAALAKLIEYTTEKTQGYSRRLSMQIVRAKEIARMCAASESERKDYREIAVCPMLGIDDLGEEPTEVMSYGMVYTPLIDVISERYERLLPTIITTNLTDVQLADKYKIRISDRFHEMLHTVRFLNKSYR